MSTATGGRGEGVRLGRERPREDANEVLLGSSLFSSGSSSSSGEATPGLDIAGEGVFERCRDHRALIATADGNVKLEDEETEK